jgi:hypothetical protein
MFARAFRAYEDARRPTTARVVQMNRADAPEGVIGRDELQAILKSHAIAAGFGKELVNSPPPC